MRPVSFLLVDDLEENLLSLEALLRRDNILLLKARSGDEALELLLKHEVALALIDVQMPGLDGFELAELMRGNERTRSIPIIFVTAGIADNQRRFRGYEAGAVDFIQKPIEPLILRNKADVFFELASQRQELAAQRDELRMNSSSLASALRRLEAHRDNSPLGVVEFDAALNILHWSSGASRLFGWSADEIVGKSLAECDWIDVGDAAYLRDIVTEPSLIDERDMRLCRNKRADGSAVDCEWYYSVLVDPIGSSVSINAQILDVSERRRSEETQLLLIGELNHRVKNTLATVQAIASQTLRHAPDPGVFTRNFTGRIQSLARAHSLLSEATWQGASLNELIADQFRLGAVDAARFEAVGPEVWLAPETALHLALILHELCTNALKYGALSTPDGTVALMWRIQNEQLHLNWLEKGGPRVKAPKRRGFGTTLIEQSAKAEGGAAHADYRADGIAWDLIMPLPLAAAPSKQPAPEPQSAQLSEITQPESKLRGCRVLIVEDETMIALEIEAMLEDVGITAVGPAGTVEQALQMIEAREFDVALLDGNLHGKPVTEVAAALTRAKVPFIFVSGYGRANLPSSYEQIGVLTKPFTEQQLLSEVERLVRHIDQVGLRAVSATPRSLN